jgi:hypothetical protein
VRTLVESHLQGKRNVTLAIHKLLALELIHRLFIDRAISVNSQMIEALAKSHDRNVAAVPNHAKTQRTIIRD